METKVVIQPQCNNDDLYSNTLDDIADDNEDEDADDDDTGDGNEDLDDDDS